MGDWITALSAQAFAVVLYVPCLVPIVLRAAVPTRDDYGRWGTQWILMFLSFYLTVCQLVLYILQYALNAPRPNPFELRL